VGCGGATGALNHKWEVAEAADDGGQELWRSSSEAWRSERRKRSRMGVRMCKSESVGSSGMCFKSRRRHGEQELLLASRRALGARGDVERRGEGQRGSDERRARRWRGTWRGEERRGAAGARESGR
jgi:hypothetical protein